MLQIINDIHIEKCPFTDFEKDIYLEKIENKKFKFYLERCIDLSDKLQIKIKMNELYLLNNKNIIAYTKKTKTKIDLCFPIIDDMIHINLKYEKIKQKEIIIELKDEIGIWEIIQKKFNV
jgi:hypothetical protein